MTEESEDRPMWTGPCIGGPMNHHDGVSRYPAGFLLVDRATGRVWIYDCIEEPSGECHFLVRETDGRELIDDPAAPKNRFRAAEEAEFDIRAAESATSDDVPPVFNAVEEDE